MSAGDNFMKRLRAYRRYLAVVLLISVIVIASYAYYTMNKDGLPQTMSSETASSLTVGSFYHICIDLSTGTNGIFSYGADSIGTSELSGRWVLSSAPPGSGVPTPAPAVSVLPQYNNPWNPGPLVWATTPYVSFPNGGPSGRINWISYQNPPLNPPPVPHAPAGPYVYQITFSVPWAYGGTLSYAAAADDLGTLELKQGTTTTVLTSGIGFPTWSPLNAQIVPPGTYTLEADVTNGPSVTGLAVYALLCPKPAAWTYTAKFICNVAPQNASAAESLGLVPGEYKTDINVHNHNYTSTVSILKKFVVSVPEPTMNNGMVTANNTKFLTTNLGPDGAFRIDCAEIMALLYNSTAAQRPTKGWVILTTNSTVNLPPMLDVWAEYTAESFSNNNLPIGTPGVTSTGISMDVQQIKPASQ